MPGTIIDVASLVDRRPVGPFQVRVFTTCSAVSLSAFGGITPEKRIPQRLIPETYGSRGSPSSRSAMMLSCTSDVPP